MIKSFKLLDKRGVKSPEFITQVIAGFLLTITIFSVPVLVFKSIEGSSWNQPSWKCK